MRTLIIALIGCVFSILSFTIMTWPDYQKDLSIFGIEKVGNLTEYALSQLFSNTSDFIFSIFCLAMPVVSIILFHNYLKGQLAALILLASFTLFELIETVSYGVCFWSGLFQDWSTWCIFSIAGFYAIWKRIQDMQNNVRISTLLYILLIPICLILLVFSALPLILFGGFLTIYAVDEYTYHFLFIVVVIIGLLLLYYGRDALLRLVQNNTKAIR